MKCQRCGNECSLSHCENCKGLPKLDVNAEQIEQKVRDIDIWIADAIEFRNKFIDDLNQLLKEMPNYPELRGAKSTAYCYWAAHIKSALADESYKNPISTTIATTIKTLLDEIDVDYPADVDIFDFNYNTEKVIENLIDNQE